MRHDRQREQNVGRRERTMSNVAGAGVLALGALRLLRGHPLSALLFGGLGSVLLHRGVTGRCMGYKALGVTSEDAGETSHPFNRLIRGRQSITINKGPEEVYAFWRDFENFAEAMPRVHSVERLGGGRSRWTASAPQVGDVSWEASVVEDRPNECLAWRSLEGADFFHRGIVEFRPAPGNRGTEVHVDYAWRPPYGVVGATVARVAGASPNQQLYEALRRIKQRLESGEVATGESTSARDEDRPRDAAGEGGRKVIVTRDLASIDEFTDVAPPVGEKRFGEAAS